MTEEVQGPAPWECEIEASSKTQNPNVWTVGDIYLLSCQGSDLFELEPPLRIEFEKPKEELYALHPLQLVRAENHSFQLEVTSYRPGDYAFESLRLVGANEREIHLGKLSWKVQSVLDPNQPPQPFGGYGFISLSYSLWMMIVVMGVAVVSLLWAVVRFVQKNRLNQLVNQKVGSLPSGQALAEYGREVRKLKRQWSLPEALPEKLSSDVFVRQLQEQFELYLVKSLRLPYHCRSVEQLKPWLRRRHQLIFDQHDNEMRFYFLELQKALGLSQLRGEDCEQLYRLGIKLVNAIEDSLKAKGATARREP